MAPSIMSSRRSLTRVARARCLLALIVAAILTPTPRETQASPVSTSPAEAWVLRRILRGEEADLRRAFANEFDRVISARFLKSILVTPPKVVAGIPPPVRITNATIRGELDLSDNEIQSFVQLSHCSFEDPLNFSNARFKRGLSLPDTTFRMSADFRYMEVTGILDAKGANFWDAFFEGATISQHAFFTRAVFKNSFSALGANIGRELILDEAEFTDPELWALFDRMTVGAVAYLNRATFAGPTSFDAAKMSTLAAEDVTFEKHATFESVQIAGHARLRRARFGGGLWMDYADIGKSLDLSETRFAGVAQFFSMKVGSNAVFVRSVFDDRLTMIKAEILGILDLTEAQATSATERKNLGGVRADIVIFDKANFSQPYALSGLGYRVIDGESADQLLALIDGAEGHIDAYSGLESFFQRQGLIDEAKRVHIARRQRERHGLWPTQPGRYVWNVVQDIVAGYGQRLSRALLWSFGVLTIGILVFRKSAWMELQKPEYEPYRDRYSAFWYSLALLLPISGLEDAKIWRPRKDRWKASLYMRIHTILGYLLIPIGIAAWTGIIK